MRRKKKKRKAHKRVAWCTEGNGEKWVDGEHVECGEECAEVLNDVRPPRHGAAGLRAAAVVLVVEINAALHSAAEVCHRDQT